MKKFFSLLLIVLIAASLAACSIYKSKSNDDEIDLTKLIVYKEAYVGDNAAVRNILAHVPGRDYVKKIELQTEKLPYGIVVHYGPKNSSSYGQSDFKNYWTDEKTKKVVLNSATTLFILVKNVDEVDIDIDNSKHDKFSISREELEKFYGRDLRRYADNGGLWEKEVLNGVMASNTKINSFFNMMKK